MTSDRQSDLRRGSLLSRSAPYRAPLLVGLVALAFYTATLAPGVLWGDDAKFQLHGYLLFLTADELGHPLYVAIAHLFSLMPLGQIAWRINLVSALFGSLTLVWVFLAARAIAGDVVAATASVAAFGLSHTFWSFAVRPQAHAINAFFVALLVWAALRWSGRLPVLFAWAFVLGLGLINHFLLAFSAPAIAWLFYLRARRTGAPLLPMSLSVVFVLLGFAPFLLLSAAEDTTVRSLSVVAILRDLLVVQTPLRDVALWSGFLVYNFVGLALLLIALGARRLWQMQRGILFGIALLYFGNVWFVFDSKLPDQYKYYIPSYLALGLLVAPGYCAVRDWLDARQPHARALAVSLWLALLLVPLVAYTVAPQAVRSIGLTTLLDVRNLPGRDALAFFLEPSKHNYDGADQFARAALSQAPADAVLAGDHTLLAPIRFIIASEQKRQNVFLLDLPSTGQAALLEALSRLRPVYLVDTQKYYEMDAIEKIFEVRPVGVLYELIRRQNP